jgi:transcriptional regulator with XRE-family HTH domain
MTRKFLSPDDAPNEGVRLLRIHGRRWDRSNLARMLDVARQTLDQWFAGRRTPLVEARIMLEEKLGIPVESWERIRGNAPPKSVANRQDKFPATNVSAHRSADIAPEKAGKNAVNSVSQVLTSEVNSKGNPHISGNAPVAGERARSRRASA